MTLPPLRIALAQIAPRLGLFDENLAVHHDLLRQARADGAGLVVFPELGLTGYLLQDLASEVAIRLDDPRLASLAAETEGLSAVVSFVEESGDHRLFIAAALLEDGEIRHVHRKLFLPTYGLFDERRFFAAGDVLRATPSRLGVGLGLAVCEDFWHLAVPELLALDGAQMLINVSSSPGRDLAATNEVGLGTATSWQTLIRTYAQLTTSFVVFCNRVGVDESISFWGGSEVIAPERRGAVHGAAVRGGPVHASTSSLADVRRERVDAAAAPRRAAGVGGPRAGAGSSPSEAGSPHDSTADGWAEPGLDVAPGEPIERPIGFRPKDARRDGAEEGSEVEHGAGAAAEAARLRGRRAMTAPQAELFELPAELAIDTDVARRVIAEFIRGQLRQAGFERLVLGLSGGIDSALVAYLVRRGDRRGAAALRPDAVPDLVAGVARRRRGGRGRARAARARSSRSARWSTATSRADAATASAAPPRATSWPASGWPSCTTAR